jgi:hypothetical protein
LIKKKKLHHKKEKKDFSYMDGLNKNILHHTFFFKDIPLHEGTQSHVKYQEQFEAFHPSSNSVLLDLGKCTAGWFLIRTNQKPFSLRSLTLFSEKF